MLLELRNDNARVTDVDLDVVGNWLCGAFQEVGQAVVHDQLH